MLDEATGELKRGGRSRSAGMRLGLQLLFWGTSAALALVVVADVLLAAQALSALWSDGLEGLRQWVLHVSASSVQVGEAGEAAWLKFWVFALGLGLLTAGGFMADFRLARAIRARS
jgi:hypothetical protein